MVKIEPVREIERGRGDKERERERSEENGGKKEKERDATTREKAFELFSLLSFRLPAPHDYGDTHGKPF